LSRMVGSRCGRVFTVPDDLDRLEPMVVYGLGFSIGVLLVDHASECACPIVDDPPSGEPALQIQIGAWLDSESKGTEGGERHG
jgi:hypothetical protein